MSEAALYPDLYKTKKDNGPSRPATMDDVAKGIWEYGKDGKTWYHAIEYKAEHLRGRARWYKVGQQELRIRAGMNQPIVTLRGVIPFGSTAPPAVSVAPRTAAPQVVKTGQYTPYQQVVQAQPTSSITAPTPQPQYVQQQPQPAPQIQPTPLHLPPAVTSAPTYASTPPTSYAVYAPSQTPSQPPQNQVVYQQHPQVVAYAAAPASVPSFASFSSASFVASPPSAPVQPTYHQAPPPPPQQQTYYYTTPPPTQYTAAVQYAQPTYVTYATTQAPAAATTQHTSTFASPFPSFLSFASGGGDRMDVEQ